MRIVLYPSFALILVLISCGSVKEVNIKPSVSRCITGKVQKTIFNRNSIDSSICAIEYNYFEPDELVYRDSVNQKIGDFAIKITQFGGRPTYEFDLSNDFFQAQLDSFELINKAEIEDYDDGLNQIWELQATIEIDDSRDEFVQLHLTAWSYTGGAHGNGSTLTYLIDKTSGKSLKLNDLFSDVTAITDIGEKYFRKLYELESGVDLEEAGFWFENNKFHLNNNISIVGDTIEILFNSYEIAPYSVGQTVIEIPIEEVKNYIKIKI